jgi:trk system potassium uptake protein TrkH
MVRLFPILHVLSAVIAIFGLTMLVPLALAHALEDGAAFAYDEAILLTFGAGAVLWVMTREHKGELQTRDGFLLVSLVWTVLPAFATMPLLFAIPGLSFTDAYFEAVSGLTTSGATVLTGLDHLPPSINLWRTQLVWMGGMGVVVLAVAILPLLGVGGAQVFRAETPGPMKDQKLTPRIAQTAKGLWLVYGLITIACVAAFKWAGMSWLDAVMHGFSTMGLGGFSSHDDSFAWFKSATIDYVTVAFMLIAGINFGTHFLFLRNRSVAVYRRDPEVLPYLAVTLGSSLFIALFLLDNAVYDDFATALRYATFNVVSIATTTGFATTDYALWPVFAPVWMLFLSSFATSSGSTGGGIKMVRALLQVKQAWRELRRIVHPRAFIPVKLGGQVVENNIIFAVLAFMLMYGATLIVSTMLLAFTGLDIVTAFSAVIACINNMGPGLGTVGPASNYQGLSNFQTWVCTATMLLGRLELFTLLVVFTPSFWRQ